MIGGLFGPVALCGVAWLLWLVVWLDGEDL